MFFHDALYGDIDLNISSKILSLPELQRLREVRLCNINSPFITGGSNINRFEHAIGTAYLAQVFSEKHFVRGENRKNFIIASLLHDVVTAPFGHSLEYLFSALGKKTTSILILTQYLPGKQSKILVYFTAIKNLPFLSAVTFLMCQKSTIYL